jgi:nucleotide-binding universal stress UspA family protein
MRIQNILVPVDFSPPSKLAVDHGISLARKCRAKLTLLHVVESSATKDLQDQVLRSLSSLVASEDQDDLDLAIVMKSGKIEEHIFKTIHEQKADLVVMGTHGRGLLGRWFIGSVTQGVLRKVAVPILTVSHVARPSTFKRLMFATDFSLASLQAFSRVLELAQMMAADVVVFHALQPMNVNFGGNEMAQPLDEQDFEDARRRLAEYETEGARWKVKVETMLVEGRAAKEVLKAAEDNDIDAIVLAVQRKGLLERTFLGTSAEMIIRDAHLPVLSIPVAAEAAHEQLSERQAAKP